MISKSLIKKLYDSIYDTEYDLQMFFARYLEDINYSKYVEDFYNFYDSDEAKKLLESEDFHNWLLYEIEYTLGEKLKKIENLFKNGKLTIWRAMTVSNNWIKNLANNKYINLGIFWSWDEKGAVSHWGNYKLKNKVVIESSVEKNKIDWDNTLLLNSSPEMEDEMEIRLKPNINLKITKIIINNKNINMNDKILNKTFKS